MPRRKTIPIQNIQKKRVLETTDHDNNNDDDNDDDKIYDATFLDYDFDEEVDEGIILSVVEVK